MALQYLETLSSPLRRQTLCTLSFVTVKSLSREISTRIQFWTLMRMGTYAQSRASTRVLARMCAT
jgi:hypothetical protein